MSNSVMKSAKVHKPFNYKGGHPDYPEPTKGLHKHQSRLCVVDDGVTLVIPGVVVFKSEKVLLHIPREQIREVRHINESTALERKLFVDVDVELGGSVYTARFQAFGGDQMEDVIRLTMEIKRLTFPRN